jgi:hypothetical protein
MSDILSYGNHSPLGKTLDIPETRDPGKYVGRHRLTRVWRWRRNVGGRFRVNRKKLQ